MNKTSLIVRLAGIVLSAGLVSCAKDEAKTRDTFRAPPPVIYSRGAQDLRSWDLRNDKALDLQDSFDVSASRPEKLVVTARCRRDKVSSIETFEFTPHEPIKIFEILPGDLLTRDFAVEKCDCAFELILSNGNGSKHIYNISSTPIIDLTGAGVTIEKTGTDEKVSQINSRALEGYRARYRNSGSSTSQIFCQDIILPDIPFEQVIDLNHFDFSKPEIKRGLPHDSLAENPLQACRAIVQSAGQRKQISARFLVRFPQAAMVATLTQTVPTKDQKFQFYGGAPLEIGVLHIKNPNRDRTRFLVLRKNMTESTVEIFGPALTQTIFNRGNIVVNAFTLNWLAATPGSVAGVIIEDKGDHWRLTLPGGSTAQIGLKVVPFRPRVCPDWSIVALSEDLAISGKTQLTEASESGEVLVDKTFIFPRTSFPGPEKFEKRLFGTPFGRLCGW